MQSSTPFHKVVVLNLILGFINSYQVFILKKIQNKSQGEIMSVTKWKEIIHT